MGKLNIAHHKSYHPYRRDNIERVRRDEAEAERKEAEKEGRIVLADAEARLDLLRQRVGLGTNGKGKNKEHDVDVSSAAASGTGIGSGKHINLFEDLEQQEMVTAMRAGKKAVPSEAEKGVPLAPSTKDLNPWYSDKNRDRNKSSAENDQDERRMRDLASKTMNDPLTAITHQLSRSSSTNGSHSTPSVLVPRSRNQRTSRPPDPPPRLQPPKQLDPTSARLSRESSERERALALIRRKQREMAGSETPSTVHGGMDGGYADVFNRREVEEAHAHRDRWRRQPW